MPELTITLTIDPKKLYRQRLLLCYLEEFDVAEGPIAGLLNLTDAIADKLVTEHPSPKTEQVLLGRKEKEDELGRKMIAELFQNIFQNSLTQRRT
jgi:hypothetical protein